ncbi:MAG: HlyD family efflux transporter periplasmic adaptor subunit, partial [Clostridia bacterium]|nr:HlyD family efflux transporter periplasmic adaptor subunit [Clostridia bacterium]
ASRSGTVTEVSFRAGEVATDGAAALVIEVVESGYTLSFSVSNNEAARLNIGDAGNVSGTYWGQNVGAVLSKITPDAGGKTKTLTFDLTGDVNVGQNLTVIVGERSTGYASVIPKSALHEDANGKFIYITKTKSTPLGDRFVATRLDVSVAASDDKNVAITTDEAYLYEYLITSSTKPFEEGDYVRLSD